MTKLLIENLRCAELKALQVIIKSLGFISELDSLMHGLELYPNLMLTSGCPFTLIVNFYSLQSNVAMRNLPIMEVVYDLKQLSYD